MWQHDRFMWHLLTIYVTYCHGLNKNCTHCHSVCSSLVSDAKQNSVILKYLNVQMERNIEFELMVYSILNKTLSSPALSLPSPQHRLPTADSVKDF